MTKALERPTTVSPSRPGGPVRRRSGTLRRRSYLRAYAFVAPSIAIMAAFVVWPIISSARLSFFDSSQFGPSTFVGLDNYRAMFRDPTFRGDLERTVVYAVIVTPITIGLALMFAVMLHRRLRGRAFFRAAIFLPAVLSLGVMAIAWNFLLNPDIGLLPHWLEPLGISFGHGTADPTIAFAYVAVVGVWKNVGFYMVMYLAGLATIPAELYDAAGVDGASPFQKFRHVTWPLLANTSAFVFIIATIASLQAFDQVYVMTRGGPYFQTETLVYLLYRKGFQDFQFGYASAVGWVLILIVFVISIVQNAFFSRRQVTY
ncbi:carbohydrate ABC transporter membrane protein 1, CUT1 family [Jatrophihabitans endophyticus]|uniref:Carbohydrate ABC transporter membrane protein 1, CUT1 family n=1 Tax=Jatrophihabitans endophyticus TaxID=1206085 RepID=A0A1M5DFZ7_9ACTN|nr:sugar ABC transporter permease [Jatrophihabitans endophyticus]SHF65907.1 carbohydrate ABC transporter membrane protein 1, CUT1 family [Jatrophihabitans endophyticus]